MEQKDIDIYEILKGMPDGTPLYTSLCGNVEFTSVEADKEKSGAIRIEYKNEIYCFDKNGKWTKGGEALLFPSKEMRDWSKFAWKRGDVLVSNDGCIEVIFDKWYDDTYTSFYGKHYLDCENENDIVYIEAFICTTERYSLEDKESFLCYINTLEDRLGGKLNLKTLEVEKQPKFKDGDILLYKSAKFTFFSSIFILNTNGNKMSSYARFSIGKESIDYNVPVVNLNTDRFRYATEKEKQELFNALAKVGKAWDAEKKMIVNLKPAFEIGKLYVFDEEDEDGNVTVIGELIGKYESEDTLRFGNQYEIETEKFVTDQAFDLRISVHEELREATENEIELFEKHYSIWEKGAKEQPAFKPFDKVLVRNEERSKWQPAFFVRDRGEETIFKYKVLSIQSGRVADFHHCIPFEGNENIAFTDYDENLPF